MSDKSRPKGFYWVNIIVCIRVISEEYWDNWIVAEWNGKHWLKPGNELCWGDEDFDEIGEKVDR